MAKNKLSDDAPELTDPNQESVALVEKIVPVAEPVIETPAPKARKKVVSVREWASDQAAHVGLETASAFYSQYPHDYADPQELANAMDAYRNRVISD